jgi:hypothetical protein
MTTELKAKQSKEFMQQHSLTFAQRDALILEKFERSKTYIVRVNQLRDMLASKRRKLTH